MTRFVHIAGAVALKLIGVISLFMILIVSFVVGIITITVVSITSIIPGLQDWLAKRSPSFSAWFELINEQGRGEHTGTFGYVFLVSGLLCYRAAYKVIANIFFKEKRRLAADPTTAPEMLRALSKSFDSVMHKAIAGNPNTPIDILWKLIEDFPHEVVNNPVFPLIALESPDWITAIPQENLITLLKKPNIPEVIVQSAIQHPDSTVQAQAKSRPNSHRTAPKNRLRL
jgi:hypothetical protein